ncbi:MAG: DNA-binding NarL/FixJ family response regulator [Limisphaerales bacterium]|jgi:DNA-binding NarL/FixJ family response regulator
MSDSSLTTVMLVDDHFVVRSGLAASLELEDDIEVVAEADQGEDAVKLYQQHQPKVVMMDLQLPGQNGIEVTRDLLAIDPDARVMIFSTFARDDEVQTALEAGAVGYLQKSAGREDLMDALRSIAAGKTFLPTGLAERLKSLEQGPVITPREREILALIAQGRANKEIAAELGNAEDTVKRHISNILEKFGVSDRAQATAEAIRRGIVKVEE